MKIFLIAVVLVAAASADQYWEDIDWIDYRLVNTRDDLYSTIMPSTTSAPICTKPGPTCDQCKDLYICTTIGGTLVPTLAEKCSGNLPHCNIDRCSATQDPYCVNEKFKCTEVEGMYPDPISCKDFHYCVPEAGKPVPSLFSSSCGEDYAYNSKTTYCDKKLTNQTCPTELPVPICTSLLQTAALKENPSMYYICMDIDRSVLYPNLYICDNGGVYNGNFTCKAK